MTILHGLRRGPDPASSSETGESRTAEPVRVVVVGGGFAGLAAVRGLRSAPVAVTLVDPTGYQVFQPLLYQAASGVLAPQNIASSHPSLQRRQANLEVVQAEATGIDPANRHLVVADPLGEEQRLAYDVLVLAVGLQSTVGRNPAWAEHALSLTTLEDAAAIRQQVFSRLRSHDENGPVVVVGGGPTGVELAGALAEAAGSPRSASVVLLEAGDSVLPAYPQGLREAAAERLRRLGVEVRLDAPVDDVTAQGVVVAGAPLEAQAVLWAAGSRVRPVVSSTARELAATTDRQGRIVVAPDLTVPGHPEVFVVGDAAAMVGLPPLAPAAMQTGAFAARVIAARAREQDPPELFRYLDKGSMAVVSADTAVAVLGPGLVRTSGGLAKLLWLGVHLYYLPGLSNRLATAVHWAGRASRPRGRSRLGLAA